MSKVKINKTNQPLVSVYMPVYNAEAFVAEAIQSVLDQTYKNFELIVVDDKSTDGSWDVVRRLQKQNPNKIKAVRLEKNLNSGGDAAGNEAFKMASGEYLARMDADDVAMPERLETQVAYLEQHPDVAVLGSCATVIDKNGLVVGEKNVELSSEDIYKAYFVLHPMIHPTLMIRKSALNDTSNLYDLRFGANNDYLTFFGMIAKGKKFVNLPDKLLKYRVHGNNDSLVQVRSRFLNSLKIRYIAVREFGYKPSMGAVVRLMAQVVLVGLLPEKVIVPLYMLVRGIYKKEDVVAGAKQRLARMRKKLLQWEKRVVYVTSNIKPF